MRKNTYKVFPSSKAGYDVFLPKYTRGIKWKNSNILTASNDLSTLEDQSVYKSTVKKVDDNNFKVTLGSMSHNSTMMDINPFMEAIDVIQGDGYFIVHHNVNKKILNGMTIKTDRPMLIYIYFAMTAIPNASYNHLGFELYANGKLLRKFEDFRKLDYEYVGQQFLWLFFLEGWTTYVYPVNGEITLKAKTLSTFSISNMELVSNMKLIFLDSQKENVFPVDQHVFAYEEN